MIWQHLASSGLGIVIKHELNLTSYKHNKNKNPQTLKSTDLAISYMHLPSHFYLGCQLRLKWTRVSIFSIYNLLLSICDDLLGFDLVIKQRVWWRKNINRFLILKNELTEDIESSNMWHLYFSLGSIFL